MLPSLTAVFALSLVLIPVAPDALESAQLNTCASVKNSLKERGLPIAYDGERLVSVNAQFLDRDTHFSYRCSDGQVVLQAISVRASSQEQAVIHYDRLLRALESELGHASKTGQDPLEPACVLKKAGLTNLDRKNATWIAEDTQVIATVFMPPSGSTEWTVGVMRRRGDSPDCGIQLD